MTAAPVKIYVTAYCPYCHAALRLLDDKGVTYERVDVDGDRAARAWLRAGLHRWPLGGWLQRHRCAGPAR